MARGEPPQATLVARLLTQPLEEAKVPYAIGGALAYGLWSAPRATRDVDINLFLEAARLPEALSLLVPAGLEIDPVEAASKANAGDTVVGHYQGMRIDLFMASIPFSWEAMRTRVRVSDGEAERWYLSAEAITVFKLLFFRSKDKTDVEYLVATRGSRLDAPYVRLWLVEMMGEDDERVIFLDGIVAEHWRPPS